MATDLTKMVADWTGDDDYTYKILKALAIQIEANREQIKSLVYDTVSLGYRIDTLKEEIDKLKIRHGERIDPKGVNDDHKKIL